MDLHDPKVLRIIGVHDALSALLCTGQGFGALWLSSFGVSTAEFGIPDAGLLTLTEMMETVRRVRLVSRLPLIVDADTGYGGALNTARLMQQAYESGVDAICIEDAAFPKRNSFTDASLRRLSSPQEMCERILIATRSRKESRPLVIARTEALTQGHSLEEALQRAGFYAQSGADAILVHSTKEDGMEVQEFAQRWRNQLPLFVVPTAYPHIPFRRYEELRIKGVVLANQVLRAAFTAIREVTCTLARAEKPADANGNLCSMREIHQIVGLYRSLELEQEIADKAARAVALKAAASSS